MSMISHDLKAIASICSVPQVPVRAGILEGPGAATADVRFVAADAAWIEGLVDNMFAEQDGRIALVYVDSGGQDNSNGAWLSAARKCTDEIVGVLVLARDSAGSGFAHERGEVGEFLTQMPQALWDGELPLLFDESGLISELSPKSKQIEIPANLSFGVPIRQWHESILKLGQWRRGPFPIWDVTGLPDMDDFICLKIQAAFDDAENRCQMSLNRIAHPENVHGILNVGSFAGLCDMMEKVLPASVDRKALEAFGSLPEIKKRAVAASAEPCCVILNIIEASQKDPDLLERLSQVENAKRRLVQATHLIAAAFADYNVYYAGYGDDDPDKIADDLHRICTALGVDEQMRALDAGVPFDDVIA